MDKQEQRKQAAQTLINKVTPNKFKSYTVSYEIEVYAINPKQAALKAEKILDDMIYRPCLKVVHGTDEPTIIDLEKE